MDKIPKKPVYMPYIEPKADYERAIEQKEYGLDERNWKKTMTDVKKDEVHTLKEYDKNEKSNEKSEKEIKEMGEIPVMPAMQVLAMAYVPKQKWYESYSDDVALARGTLFPELDKPFIGEGGPQYDR